MSAPLTESQVAQYKRDGFAMPFRAFSAEQATKYRAQLEAYERDQGKSIATMNERYKSHVLFPWSNEIARNPTILDAVEQVIGPDILVFTSTFFIKDAHTPSVALWHQDWRFFGLRPHEHVTAWVALSNASAEAGCMKFLPGKGNLREMKHMARAHKDSINDAGQRIVEDFDEGDAVDAALTPGEFSLHHTLCVHSSAPNNSDDRRIGLGISYIPASVKHIGTLPISTMLVRGKTRHDQFELEPDPTGDYDIDHRQHDISFGRYRAAYNEQVKIYESELAA